MTRREHSRLPVIHAITNEEIVCETHFVERARAVMEALGTRGAVHLRASTLGTAFLYAIAEKLADAQQATESWLVINDRVDIALGVGARGAQLTSRSMSVRDAAPIAGRLALGASVHSVAEAVEAEKNGAAWIVAGHIYPTKSHLNEAGRGEELIAEIAWRVAAPVIAIGGITPERVGSLRSAGAYGVAAIRGIWRASDAAAAATDYLSHYDSDGDSQG